MQVGLALLGIFVVVVLFCHLGVEFLLGGNQPAKICRSAIDGQRCTRLALPDEHFCRAHLEEFARQAKAGA
jgi:hypothetical protein